MVDAFVLLHDIQSERMQQSGVTGAARVVYVKVEPLAKDVYGRIQPATKRGADGVPRIAFSTAVSYTADACSTCSDVNDEKMQVSCF
ncbi:hypothetical protein GUJ93_ZPchr0010g10230 [Zizania palustris]|uniref:Uncharacterized protein n=1 Tax=Zizania palustris TaxID=103762 RepID=A0A8J5WEN5_ZIZPA|nr:hypothetical protein GUJ93_ZPchr0010g10230 [Zizania palustris]